MSSHSETMPIALFWRPAGTLVPKGSNAASAREQGLHPNIQMLDLFITPCTPANVPSNKQENVHHAFQPSTQARARTRTG